MAAMISLLFSVVVEARTARGPAVPHEVTRLNDVVFSGYHVFRSEMRILPE